MKKFITLLLCLVFTLCLSEERSPEWHKVRSDYLKKNPVCILCKSIQKLEVHHRIPFHIDPSKELLESNLITLCESNEWGLVCHRDCGHGGNYSYVNINVEEDAAKLREIGLRTKCYQTDCMKNNEFFAYVTQMKERVRNYNCQKYNKCFIHKSGEK